MRLDEREASRGDRWVVAYAWGGVRWRWVVLLGSLLVAAISIAGLGKLVSEADYRYHFMPDNPELIAFTQIEQTYTKVDNVLFVVAPRDGRVFEPSTLQATLWLTERSWQLPHSIRVDSVTNFQDSWADRDGLVVEDLVDRTERNCKRNPKASASAARRRHLFRVRPLDLWKRDPPRHTLRRLCPR